MPCWEIALFPLKNTTLIRDEIKKCVKVVYAWHLGLSNFQNCKKVIHCVFVSETI